MPSTPSPPQQVNPGIEANPRVGVCGEGHQEIIEVGGGA